MRLSVNTLVLALISSSILVTDVFAVPLHKNAASRKSKLPSALRNKGPGPRSLATRQDAQNLNLTQLATQFQFLEEAVAGISAVMVAVSSVVDAIGEEIGLDGDNTGDDGQNGGDGSGDDSNGDSGDGTQGGSSNNGGNSTAIDTSNNTSSDGTSISNVKKRQDGGASSGDLDGLCALFNEPPGCSTSNQRRATTQESCEGLNVTADQCDEIVAALGNISRGSKQF
ncbi:hypothetical protein Clacol_010070 [Clathrus columnatus]|uniref:Uncharacterized protein n=1 Tax=Clathrus columnatus TaxID=1419009 RepID=A0AAV5APV9_9AGAM|nr:hypothetical protein Clacol_010070 [Clathrus columnatus]